MSDQIITPVPDTQTVSAGEAFSIDVNYSTADPANASTTGLGLEIFWDSSQVSFTELTNLLDISGVTQPTGEISDDTSDLDGDPNTDRFFVQAWLDLGSNFPTADPTFPQLLYTANFTAVDGFTGTTINFSDSATANNFDFVSTPAVINAGDAPLPTLSIDDVTVTEGDTGNVEATFTVTLSEAADAAVTVDYATADDTATVGQDYVENTGTLTFEAGVTTQTITVEVIGDTDVEPDETFFVNLSNVSDNVTLADMQGIGTIADDDAPTVPTLSIDDVAVTEGDTGNVEATFTVTLSEAADAAVTVDYATADDTATVGQDYVENTGTLTFEAGVTTQTITVEVIGDTDVEPDETFFVNLSNVSDNVTLEDMQGTGTIADDDEEPVTNAQIITPVPDAQTVLAGNDFTIDVNYSTDPANTPTTGLGLGIFWDSSQVLLTGLPNLLEIEGVTQPTGVVEEDVEDLDGDPNTDRFLVQAWLDLGGNFPSATPADSERLFTANFTAVDGFSGTTVNFSDSAVASGFEFVSTSATIEAGTAPELSIDDVTVTEGDSGDITEAVFTVTLSEAVDSEVTVDFSTAADTASADDGDYTPINGTLTFDAGETSQTIAVEVIGDPDFEEDETFFVNLENASNNAIIADAQGIGTILNDDEAAPVELSINDVTVTEGDSGDITEAVFTISLSEAADSPVTVNFTTAPDTASADDGDYTPISDTLTFEPGETSLDITVEVIGDTEVEPDETFFVNLDDPTDNAIITDPQGIGTILNDDEAAPVELSIDDVTVTEGDSGDITEATFTVTLSEAADSEVTVEFATQADTASAADGDYVAIDDTLTFEPGITSQTITVEVIGDPDFEGDETFFVNLENASDNAIIVDGQGIGTILNDDAAPVELSIDDVTVTEGDSGDITEAVFTVTLSEAADSEVTVDFATQANTASAADGDYVAIGGTLIFEAGETSQTIAVEVIGDTDIEADETFFINLENASDNAVIEDAQGIGTILNDDERNLIEGTPGDDTLSGTDGGDRIVGLSGNDLLIGGQGSDLLEGLEGFDTLNGGAGMDIIVGGPDRDFLIGGTEGDLFVLPTDEASQTILGSDRILAFQVNFFNPAEPIDRIGLTDGLTEDDLFLQGAGNNTVVRIAASNDILGLVVGVTPERLGGTFVSIDDVGLL